MPHLTGPRTPAWLRGKFGSDRFLAGVTSGALVGISEVVFSISLGTLIFSGPLAPFLPYGIGIALATATVTLIVVSLASGVSGVIASTQDSTSVILAVIAASLAGEMVHGEDQALVTVLMAIFATTLLTGVFLFTLGFFNLGKLIRFIPYPVVGGFLAGTGWLLAQGSFGVMADTPLTVANIPVLLQAPELQQWLPGVAFALLLFFGLRSGKRYWTMHVILIGAVVVFYVGLSIVGLSIPEAIEGGLLLGASSGKALWQPFAPQHLLTAEWGLILGQVGNIAAILILSAVSLLLNASALELAIRQDIDLNRELRAAGFSNILSALGGGMVGYHTLSLSSLSHRLGAKGRLPGLVAGGICLAMFLSGASLVAYFPKAILGGLLLFMGLDFLVEWVIAGWSRLSRADYAVVLLILAVIGATNFLVGVGAGIVAMITLFVLNYSRMNVVHHALSGAEISSNVERCAYHRRALIEKLGQHIHILELQGFLFFGTASAVLEKIRDRVARTDQPPARFIMLDFRRVTGLDSSAAISFAKGKQIAEQQGTILVLTQLSEAMRRQLEAGGVFLGDPSIRVFPDLDRGLEWCEGELLAAERITILHVPVTLSAQLADCGFEKADTARLMAYLERLEAAQGEYLFRQGEEADRLYFIEQGTVSVYLELDDGKQVRLQTLDLGTAVGEPGLYLGSTCTASVIADWPVTAYRLTRMALSRMKEEEPDLAATFHEFVARLLSERLVATTRTLEAVLR